MIKRIFWSLLIVHFSIVFVCAQIPTGTWRTHFDYTKAKGLEIVQNGEFTKIFCFSGNGFFYYDKNKNEYVKLSKIEGLNDAQISKIRYNKALNLLLVAYQNGNLDLLKLSSEGTISTITNIDFIKKTSAIQGSKKINGIEFQGNYAYLACDFGLVELDVLKPEIKETYLNIGKNGTQIALQDIAFSKDSIFVTTANGTLGATFSSTVNLQYFGNWSLVKNNLFSNKNIFPKDLSIVSPVAIATDNKGTIWLADSTNGLLSNLSGMFKSYSPNGVLGSVNNLYFFNTKLYAIGNKTSVFQEDNWQLATEKINFSSDLIDHNGYRWHNTGDGILITDSKKSKSFFIGAGNLLGKTINTLAEDKNGQVWIGTDNGVSIISSSANIFNSNIVPYSPIFNGRRLLLQENVSKIAVDGGNRKWMGTTNGIYLFSAAADELIQNFTAENSPLPSNQLLDIAIDSTSGEVYMATAQGLVSYRSNATEAASTYSGAKIFPNPVRPEFSGILTISGLTDNSFVKITDSAGRLLYQTTSNGGTATLDLYDNRGNKAETGIYLIFAVSEDGKENFVGKLAIIR